MVVARWVVKTITLHHYMDGKVPVPQLFLDWLLETTRTPPPKGTHVWIAKYIGVMQNRPVLPESSLEPMLEPRFDWKYPWFTLGELAMFVAHQRVEIEGTFTHRAEHHLMLTRVFPTHSDTIVWPPKKRVGKADLGQINGSIIVP